MEYGLSNEITVENNSLLLSILNTVDDGILTFNRQGDIKLFSPAAERLFGYPADEVIGQKVSGLLTHSLSDTLLESQATTAGTLKIESKGIRQDGSEFPLEMALSPPSSPAQPYTAVIKDVSEQKKLQALALVDGLTEVANRRCFTETLHKEISRANRTNAPLSLILCDIDHFKRYNDHFGHVAGDHCLKQVAQTLDKCFKRAGDLTARYGGEEFAIILPNTNIHESARLAEKMRESVESCHLPHAPETDHPFVTISVGVASLNPKKFTKAEELTRAADLALYQAKQKGRNCIAANPIISKPSISLEAGQTA